jgi:hypothetical protein
MRFGLPTDQDICDLIIEIVGRARAEFGIPEGTSGAVACLAMGLKLRRANISQAGLVTEEGEIFVSSTITWQPRIEFTIFHEILHWLLNYHYSEIFDVYTHALGRDEAAFREAEERCCNAGAAEFLLPRHRVREAIRTQGFSVDLIESLADCHGSSLLATAIQLALNAPMPCYVVVCSHGRSPLYPFNVGLHVELAAQPNGMPYPWRRGSDIPKDHLLSDVWRTKQSASGPSSVTFHKSGQTIPCEHGEAKLVRGRVVGILYRGHPHRKGQLRLELLP